MTALAEADGLAEGPGEDDILRAQVYTLLGQTLARPPGRALLDLLSGLRGDGTPFGRALDALAARARGTDERRAEREHHDLFIGVVRGELVPYASYYRTGFLHDRPLARVRDDLQALGIERAPDTAEPEDHIACLCEVMAALISGALGPPDLHGQRRFFERHIAPWAGRFFADLEDAQAADLYRPVGTIGRLFLDIETNAYAMLIDAGGGQDAWEGTGHAP